MFLVLQPALLPEDQKENGRRVIAVRFVRLPLQNLFQ